MKFEMIACVEASDMPKDVKDWCEDRDYDTHYQNDVAQVYNDDNPFANWLRELGYVFKCPVAEDDEEWDKIAIIST